MTHSIVIMMTMTSELLSSYRIAAIAHHQATLEGDAERTIQTADELERATNEVLGSGVDGWKILQPLLHDPDPRVKLAAACDLLPRNVFRAKAVLYLLSLLRRDELGLLAKLRLHVWKYEGR